MALADALRLELLGGLRITMNGEPLGGFSSSKAQALLCYLAVSSRAHPREALAALLWGDMPAERAAQSLRQALVNLQKLVGPYLLVTRQTVAFNRASPYEFDVEAFVALSAAAETVAFGSQRRLRAAAELYAGDFLAGFSTRDAPEFDEWVAAQRERLRLLALGALHTLAVRHLARGEYVLATGYLRRLLGLDPWREDAHRQLMLLLAWQGQRDAAIAQYHACRRALAGELGEEPAAETVALHQRIRAGALEPPATHAALSSNLPRPPSALIGRQAELASVSELLLDPTCRLLTLVGPGGIGKTRLAMQAATELLGDLEHGACFVSLTAIRDPRLVVDAVAVALGIAGTPGRPLNELITAVLRDREVLLVLDNFEHILSAAPLVAELLGAAPRLKALVTSRASLRLRGERIFEVPPLALPTAEDANSAAAAVTLFVERARAVAPGFALSATNARAVAEICRRVEGLPLAIELAAARVPLLAPAALLTRLTNRLDLLTDGARDLPARQQTMRGTIDWSFRLLTPAEQTLFARQAVFVGGRTLAAIAAVCDPDGELGVDALDGVGALVNQSLLRRVEGVAGEPRFSLLETLQEYARECLTHVGEDDLLARRHARYFAAFAEEGAAALSGPEQRVWLARLHEEHDNLRAALRWTIERGEALMALQLVGSLWPFWEARGHLSEGRRWLAEALALPYDSPGAHPHLLPQLLRGRALRGAGLLATWQGDYATARALHQESLALYRELDDQSGIANALENLGLVASQQGDYPAAHVLHAQSLSIRRTLGAEWDIAGSLSNLGLIARNQGDYDRARTLYSESLALLTAVGYDQGAANALSNLGVVAFRQGDYADAGRLHEESLALRRTLADRRGIAISLINLGLVAYAQDDLAEAQTRYQESLAITWALRDVEIAESLEGLASVAGARGEPLRAARWLGVAGALRATLNRPLPPVEQADLERWIARVRGTVDTARWVAAEAAGRALPLERAIAEALGDDVPG